MNNLQFVDWLTMEGLRVLTNKLQVAQFGNTEYQKEFGKEFAVGETIRVPMPQRYLIREGLDYSPQPLDRKYTTVSVDQIFGIDFQWDDAEAALKLERGQEKIKREYLDPAMAQIAQEIDSRFARFAYQNASNITGQLGTAPSSFQTYSSAARQRLIEQGCPAGGERGAIVPPSVMTALSAAGIAYFNPADAISRQYKEGSIGRQGGFDWYESMSLYEHTAGTWQSAVTMTAASSDGDTTLGVTCTSGDTWKKGDIIGIDLVYPVNPSTRRRYTSTGKKTFVVTQDVTATTTTATLPIYPALYGPGSQYQNVSALPAATAALTLFPGTTSPNGKTGFQGLAIHKEAFALVGVKLQLPKAVEMSSQTQDPDSGISVRFVRSWNSDKSRMENRFDVLMGFGVLYGDNCAVRMLSD